MRRFIITLALFIVVMGCARVSVQGSKEPIKLDISMRLDIYQHVEKDIDAIEGIVSGTKDNTKAVDQHSLLGFCVVSAYAQGELGPDVEQAALRRKSRISQLYALEAKGVIGENKNGLVELRDPSEAVSVKQLVDAENNDRMVIYKTVATKNAISLEEVQKLYAKRLRNDAPAGTPVEAVDEAGGSSQWKSKQ